MITHRGLEPAGSDGAWGESTVEAFEAQLRRGFGLEFDPNPCFDGWVVWHDGEMLRLTNGVDQRRLVDIPLREVAGRQFGRGCVGTLDEVGLKYIISDLCTDLMDNTDRSVTTCLKKMKVLSLIAEHGSAAAPSAMHLKGERQSAVLIDLLVEVLRRHPVAIPKLFIFDVTQTSAVALKAAMPELALAPSVSHAYDVQRYNACVHRTLWTLEAALQGARDGLFAWAWVDEWDLAADDAGGRKDPPFASTCTFAALRNAGLRVGLVTPELHSSSPSLLGGESHDDASSKERLFARIRTIAQCGFVDAICTDWPTEVQAMLPE